jgi:CelD/BcsL family acetyltransferase involved in cellulose biosynthesis
LRAEGLYDVALIKDVHDKALYSPLIAAEMRVRNESKNFFMTLNYSSEEDWFAAQPRKFRSDVQRKTKKLALRGPVVFNLFRNGDAFPEAVIAALNEQKNKWVTARFSKGLFLRPKMKDFLQEFARDAALRGILYLAWLSCGDAIVACHLGFIHNRILYLYTITYDDAYGIYSPGNILMAETIKTAIKNGCTELDFMRGEETYKEHFASGCRVLSDFVGGRSLIGKMLVRLREGPTSPAKDRGTA